MILSEAELEEVMRESAALIALWSDENGNLPIDSLSQIGRLIGIYIPKLLETHSAFLDLLKVTPIDPTEPNDQSRLSPRSGATGL